MALIKGKGIVENEQKAAEELSARGFGIPSREGLLLSPFEALYLAEQGLKVFKGNKALQQEALRKTLSRMAGDFALRYAVFKDLRNRGHVVRGGEKYDVHFRAYPLGTRPEDEPSQMLVKVVSDAGSARMTEIARSVELAHAVKKRMAWAVVGRNGTIRYYRIEKSSP